MSRAGGNLSNTEARQRLRKTAEDIGLSEDKQGNGLVDAEAAVTKPLSGGPTHTLRFEGSGGFSFYAFRATGDVDPDGNLTSEDTINGPTAFGAVGGGTDSYIFKGDLQHLYVDGGVTVFLDGQQINPDDYESVISIQGDGSYTSYEFGVSGEITGTQGTTGEDTVNPASASGAIAGGSDSYTFTGTISGLSKSGSAAVILNGQEVDPSLFSPFSGGTNSLRIEGSGEFTYYAFQASGDVSSGGNLTSEDNIDGTTAAGAVGGATDTYTFEGELQNLYVGDGATVLVNDQQVTPDDYESVLSVEGDGSYTSYEFGVSGEITGTQGTTGEDTVNPASASGAIAGGSDSYTFTGTISGLSKSGSAAVILNGQEVDPSLFSPFSGGTNSLRIEGSGEFTYYAFQASGDVSSGGNLTSEDNIDGTTAAGAVGGATDTYTFKGDLQNLYVGDGATVFLDGQQINPDDYESVLGIRGDGSYTAYTFILQPNGVITDTEGLTGEDSVDTASASGATAGGTDTYTFTGTFREFIESGDAAVILNGQEVDPGVL
jgi:uncharacterized Zn-binding protein involved in type VI secretion